MGIKKYTALVISALLIICGLSTVSYAAEPEFTVTASAAQITGAPQNSDLIVALYSGTRLTGVKKYNGTGTISADYANDMKEQIEISDRIKVFLWNMRELNPLTSTGFSESLNNLPSAEKTNRVLTVYFSYTDNTKNLAKKIQCVTNSDIYEIVPQEAYTNEILQYYGDNRAYREQKDATARPAISGSVDNIEDYDVIMLGYPIWYGLAPRIVYTFLESYDLSGKTIMPFCTSGSTEISGSLSDIRKLCPNSTVTAGFRGTSSTGDAQIQSWLNSNNFSSVTDK